MSDTMLANPGGLLAPNEVMGSDQEALRMPLEMLRAALNYVRTGDVRALLALPEEERGVVLQMLAPFSNCRVVSGRTRRRSASDCRHT